VAHSAVVLTESTGTPFHPCEMLCQRAGRSSTPGNSFATKAHKRLLNTWQTVFATKSSQFSGHIESTI